MLGVFALERYLFASPCRLFLSCRDITQWQQFGFASLRTPITLFAGLTLAVAVVAVWHGLSRTSAVLALLWFCTVLLAASWLVVAPWLAPQFFFMNLLTPLPLVGIQVAPIQWSVPAAIVASVLGLVASVAGTVAARQRVPVHA